MSKLQFIDLHVHTEFSRGKSLSNINEIVERALEFNMSALAIADSESLSGIPEFYIKCKEAGIKPILGAGFNFEPDYGFSDDHRKYHIVLLAKNKKGYRNLLKLMKAAYEDTPKELPRLDMELLAEYADDLICLSGGFGGVIDKLLLEDEKTKAIRVVEFFIENFGSENFYVELQDHEFENNKHKMVEFVNFSLEANLNVVVTGGSFYVMRTDSIWNDELRRNKNQNELDGNSYYFKSPDEIFDVFHDQMKGIENSIKIADACNVELDEKLLKSLKFNIDDDELINIDKQLEVLFNE
jgi:DNA polymerase-3 subunit alpha